MDLKKLTTLLEKAKETAAKRNAGKPEPVEDEEVEDEAQTPEDKDTDSDEEEEGEDTDAKKSGGGGKKTQVKVYDGSQSVDITNDDSLKEAVTKKGHAVLTFGRMNPPTIGHQKLVDKVHEHAKEVGGTPMVFLSHSQDEKKNPLPYVHKHALAKAAFGDVVQHSPHRTLPDVLDHVRKKHDHVTMVVGSDRVEGMTQFANSYQNDKKPHERYKSFHIVSAGERDPDSSDASSNISASKMREHAKKGDLKSFKAGLPKSIQKHAKETMSTIASRLGEEIEMADKQELTELTRNMTVAQRIKAAVNMRRNRQRLKMGEKRALARHAGTPQLNKRSRRLALNFMRRKILRNQDYHSLPFATRQAVDKRINASAKTIERLAKRLLPRVQKAELSRKIGHGFRGVNMAGMGLPQPTIKKEGLFEAVHAAMAQIDFKLDEMVVTGLAEKAAETGVSLDSLVEVYKRGALAYRAAPAANLTESQFAFNRVNSFIAGGMAGRIDSDLVETDIGLPKSQQFSSGYNGWHHLDQAWRTMESMTGHEHKPKEHWKTAHEYHAHMTKWHKENEPSGGGRMYDRHQKMGHHLNAAAKEFGINEEVLNEARCPECGGFPSLIGKHMVIQHSYGCKQNKEEPIKSTEQRPDWKKGLRGGKPGTEVIESTKAAMVLKVLKGRTLGESGFEKKLGFKIRRPDTPLSPPKEPHKSIVKGMKRVKGPDGFWKLVPEQVQEAIDDGLSSTGHKVHDADGNHIGTVYHGKYQAVAYYHPHGDGYKHHRDNDSKLLDHTKPKAETKHQGIEWILATHKEMTEETELSEMRQIPDHIKELIARAGDGGEQLRKTIATDPKLKAAAYASKTIHDFIPAVQEWDARRRAKIRDFNDFVDDLYAVHNSISGKGPLIRPSDLKILKRNQK